MTVDGQTAQLGTKADPATQVIRVDGKPLRFATELHYLALHKPVGYISSRKDPEGRPTVMELVPSHLRRLVYPVGRLDADSEGLLFLFDDGELANASPTRASRSPSVTRSSSRAKSAPRP